MQRAARIEDADRLRGVWLRPGTEPLFSTPVSLADRAPALCHVELTDVADRRRVTRWEGDGRGGLLLDGALERAAIVAWQALAAME